MTFSIDQQLFILATVFLSIFGVFGIYNLFLYFVIRRRVLLDYCVFVLSMIGFTAVVLLNILQVNLDLEGLSVIAAAFATFGGLLFSRTFFNIRHAHYPTLHYAYYTLLGLSLLVIGVQVLKSVFFVDEKFWNNITSIIAALLALSTIILFIISTVFLWKKESAAQLFVYSMTPLMIGISIYVSFWLSITIAGDDVSREDSLLLNTILFCSISLQMILFSVNIGYNLKKLELEKLALQKNINQKLTNEVDRQTQSLILANEQIEDQKNALEASNQMKNKLFSLVSHDMRGPLSGLAGLMDVLDQDKLPKEQFSKFASQLKDKIKDSVLVLNRLLQWSHAQLDEVKIHKETFSLDELIEENISLFQEQLDHKQIRVDRNLRGPNVYADREMIDTIIRNLISNGIKFTGEEKTLYISSVASGRNTELKIRDEGVGMNPDWFNHLAENEELHSEPGTDGEQGVGFGLIICRDFINMNGGSLVCESTLGQGTTFTMTLESS